MKRINLYKIICYMVLVVSFILNIDCSPSKTVHFKEVEWEKLDMENLAEQKDYPEASAVFLLDDGEFNVGENSIFTRHIIVRILNEAGLRYANIEIPFDEGNEVHNIKGRTIKKDGTVIELQPSDIHEKTLFPDFILYADSKAKVFAMPGVETGSVIEYSYSILYKIPFAPSWKFQREEPVLLSRITLEVPDFLKYRFLLAARKDFQIDKSISHPAGKVKAIFKAKETTPLKSEPFMPPPSEITSKIYFSLSALSLYGVTATIEGDSWEILGKHYWQMLKKNIKGDKAIKSQVNELTANFTSEKEKIETIYDFVQSKIRYVAIEIKRGRVIPHEPLKVFTNKYGDCKDKAFLFITMLKEVGIDAFPVLARTSYSGKTVEGFVSGQQFNHMIVAVPARYFTDIKGYKNFVVKGDKDYTTTDDFVLFDPTSRATPFCQIPWYLENTQALLVKENESKLLTIPFSSARANRTIRECEVDISGARTFTCVTKSTKTGQEASLLRTILQQLSETEKREFIENKLSRLCSGAILEDYSVSGLFDLSEPLILNYRFHFPYTIQKMKGLSVLSPNILRNTIVDALTRETRTHTICFDYPKTLIEIVKFKTGKNFNIKTNIEPMEISYNFGNYSLSCLKDGKNIVINKHFSINTTTIPADDYESVKNFFEQILQSEKSSLTISRER